MSLVIDVKMQKLLQHIRKKFVGVFTKDGGYSRRDGGMVTCSLVFTAICHLETLFSSVRVHLSRLDEAEDTAVKNVLPSLS